MFVDQFQVRKRLCKKIGSLHMDLLCCEQHCVQMNLRQVCNVVEADPVHEDVVMLCFVELGLPSYGFQNLSVTKADCFGISSASWTLSVNKFRSEKESSRTRSQHQDSNRIFALASSSAGSSSVRCVVS